jgi:hypothetical protein
MDELTGGPMITKGVQRDLTEVLAVAMAQLGAGRSVDVWAAIEACEEPIDAAAAYAELVKKVYRERKNVAAMISVGKQGVNFCLKQAAASAMR